jgi:hypothetical protein
VLTWNDLEEQPSPRPVPDADGPVARLLDRRSEERDAVADRVVHLFPRPETTEWNVRELNYDRRRRTRV